MNKYTQVISREYLAWFLRERGFSNENRETLGYSPEDYTFWLKDEPGKVSTVQIFESDYLTVQVDYVESKPRKGNSFKLIRKLQFTSVEDLIIFMENDNA